jgi:hypothetical protein
MASARAKIEVTDAPMRRLGNAATTARSIRGNQWIVITR